MAVSLYYKILPGTEAWKDIQHMINIRATRAKAINAFLKASGLKRTITVLGTPTAVIGVGDKPFNPPRAGWKWSEEHNVNVPADKATKAALANIPPGIDWMSESQRIFEHGLVITADPSRHGTCCRFAVFFWSRKAKPDVAYCSMDFSVKRAAKRWPAGLTEVLASEVYEGVQNKFKKKPCRSKKP
jgi:hypothetical protein